jgi:hypothetical protein
MTIMNAEHPRFKEFINLLSGPQGCDFKEGDGYSWTCSNTTDCPLSRRILGDMGFSEDEITASVQFFHKNGGHCDCEVVFNVADLADWDREESE